VHRFTNSWRLMLASWTILRSDRELIIIPLAAAGAAGVVSLVFVVPLWIAGFFGRLSQEGLQFSTFVTVFLFYFLIALVINFCNAALISAAMTRLKGGTPTAAGGFQAAVDHMQPILLYAAFGATAGVLLQVIRERASFLSNYVTGLADAAWGAITFLAVPVLVVEQVGPVDAIARSTTILRKTWGEQMIGNSGLGLVTAAAAVLAGVIGVIVISIGSAIGGIVLAVFFGALVVLGVAAVITIGSALSIIYKTALYRFAVDGATTMYFDTGLLREAFVKRTASNGGIRI
jgi:Family of unknown function (DUF6159)